MSQAKASSVFSEAHFISEKTQKMFDLDYKPRFLPNPTVVPEFIPEKSNKPVISWIGRWDPIKRVQLALEVARKLPDYDFHFVGVPTKNRFIQYASRNLAAQYERFPNIHIHGFISEQEKKSLLKDSWILMNTSFREGLPITFLEAAAYGLAIVSSVNPDSWSERFGKYIPPSEDFVSGLKSFIDSEDPSTFGRKAHNYVKEVHSLDKVMEQHISAYNLIIGNVRHSQ